MFRENDIIFLLGAGASRDAGILTSPEMVRRLEEKINGGSGNWAEYKQLYDYLKSSIYFVDGIRGRFDRNVNYNIERLVNILTELGRREEHPIFPFVGAWNMKLQQLAGVDFEHISELKEKIVHELQISWLPLDDTRRAAYYENLNRFQSECNYKLRVFSLNYDLCIEKTCSGVEQGFENSTRIWNSRRFMADERDDDTSLYLYKLHGSMGWFRTNEGLKYTDAPEAIQIEDLEIVFGVDHKMQYLDPYLFYIHELRKYSFDARLIVCVGYSFSDEHINGILTQALKSSSDKKVLSLSPSAKDENQERETRKLEEARIRLTNALQCQLDQVRVLPLTAKPFFETRCNLETFMSMLDVSSEDVPF